MANFTKREIKKTFAELLNQKPLSKISVKDIVDRCGVSRNTFYYYFEDIPTLLNSIVADQADELIKNHSTFDSLEDCVDVIFKYALENKKAVLHVYQSLGREIYDDFLVKACGYAKRGNKIHEMHPYRRLHRLDKRRHEGRLYRGLPPSVAHVQGAS